jgi:hypothetical protein
VALTVGIVRNESELVYFLFTMVCIHLVLCLRSSLVDKIRPQRVVFLNYLVTSLSFQVELCISQHI